MSEPFPDCQCLTCRYLRWGDENPEGTVYEFFEWNDKGGDA